MKDLPMITFITVKPGVYARFVSAPGSKRLPGILMVHGWQSGAPFADNGTSSKMQEALLEAGYSSLLVALSGHKPSEGDIKAVTPREHISEVEAALEWLRASPQVDSAMIGACGTSYGAYLLSLVAVHAGFQLAAFKVPALYPDSEWDKPMSETTSKDNTPGLRGWRSVLHTRNDSMALEGVASIQGPVALFPSELDEQMPLEVALSYKAAALASETFVTKGAQHVLKPKESREFITAFKSWFQEQRASLSE